MKYPTFWGLFGAFLGPFCGAWFRKLNFPKPLPLIKYESDFDCQNIYSNPELEEELQSETDRHSNHTTKNTKLNSFDLAENEKLTKSDSNLSKDETKSESTSPPVAKKSRPTDLLEANESYDMQSIIDRELQRSKMLCEQDLENSMAEHANDMESTQKCFHSIATHNSNPNQGIVSAPNSHKTQQMTNFKNLSKYDLTKTWNNWENKEAQQILTNELMKNYKEQVKNGQPINFNGTNLKSEKALAANFFQNSAINQMLNPDDCITANYSTSSTTNSISTAGGNSQMDHQLNFDTHATHNMHHNVACAVNNNHQGNHGKHAQQQQNNAMAKKDHLVEVDSQSLANEDTPLSLACNNGHLETVKLLVEKGANIEHRTKKGFTPIIGEGSERWTFFRFAILSSLSARIGLKILGWFWADFGMVLGWVRAGFGLV